MIEIFILSLVQGVTEFLPVSSSSHLILFSNFLDFNNHSLVQFYHRNVAYFLIIYVLFLTVFIYKRKIVSLYKPLYLLLFFLIFQIILGILTLVSGLNIYLASIHQITGVLLVFSALNLYYSRTK